MTEAARRRNEPFLPQIFTGKIRNSHRFKEPLTEKTQKHMLSKQEILQVTKSLKQNICVEMLQEGYHGSFSKFFHVLTLDQERRDLCEPSLADTLPPPLDDQPDKMKTMKTHLTRAEQAERSGSWSVVCEQYLSLAQYFLSVEDLWLRLHFLHICADVENGSSSRAATEARANLAEIYLKKDDLVGALQQAEWCMQRAEDGGWVDSSGFPLRLRVRHSLWGIYDRLADAPLRTENYSKALGLLHQAFTIAKESEDKHIEAEATYRLGVTYQLSGDHDRAKTHLNTCLKICQDQQDAPGLGKAYKAIAKSLESEGQIKETVQCLQKLTELSLTGGLQDDLVDSCLILGNIYYNMSEYSQASVYYLKGYKGAVGLGDVTLIQKTQVLLGRAQAFSMMIHFSSDTDTNSHSSIRRLIDWKETRKWQEISEDSTNVKDNTASPQQ